MAFEGVELEFPVDWHYKIICKKANPTAFDDITKTLRLHNCEQVPQKGQESSGGTYQTFKVSVRFNDRVEMETMSQALSSLPCVKYLL